MLSIFGVGKGLLRIGSCFKLAGYFCPQRFTFHSNFDPYSKKLRNAIEILGIGKKASQEEIRGAYFRLAKKFHPDTNQSPDAAFHFNEINK